MSFYEFSETQIKKQIYFTIIYRYQHSTADKVIADVVLDQFRKDILWITNLYTNSQNAGFYYGNYSPEAIYILCRQKGFRLLTFDYNEPWCGKDQWDCESAVAKSIIRSFIDSSNDLLDGDDLSKALHYGCRMFKSIQGSIDSSWYHQYSYTGDEISNISSCYSIQFHNDHMIMWC